MKLSEKLSKVVVSYDKKDKRKIECFCGKVCEVTFVTHMRNRHKKEWDLWVQDFVRLYNKGWTVKRIMWKYRAIFSWTVIEKEINSYLNRNPDHFKVKDKKVTHIKPKKDEFELPTTTVWSFENRGSWSVHSNDYRGNWPPQLAKSLIMKYSKRGDLVMDPFVGGGTTLIEACLNHRRSIGVDISPIAIKITRKRLEDLEKLKKHRNSPILLEANSLNLAEVLKSNRINKVDLVCAHPPYMNALKYTENIEGDLSQINKLNEFCDKVQIIAKNIRSILKKNGYCCVLIGDVRKNGNVLPVGFEVMKRFLDEGFVLEDTIIKIQKQDSSTPFYFKTNNLKHRIAHEYLFIFKNKE